MVFGCKNRITMKFEKFCRLPTPTFAHNLQQKTMLQFHHYVYKYSPYTLLFLRICHNFTKLDLPGAWSASATAVAIAAFNWASSC